MKKTILIFLLSTLLCSIGLAQENLSLTQNFSYNKYESIDVCFFPVEKARWNGYEVLSRDWKSFDKYQKLKYISEALEEIKDKERVSIPSEVSVDYLALMFDQLNAFAALSGERQPVITLLLKTLAEQGLIKGKIMTAKDSPVVAAEILEQMNNNAPQLEIGKVYVGYIDCYKKDDKWLPNAEGPLVGQISKQLIYASYFMLPNGTTMLSPNYPIGMEYKIIKFKEFNTFVDEYGLEVHYYKVLFEPVKFAGG